MGPRDGTGAPRVFHEPSKLSPSVASLPRPHSIKIAIVKIMTSPRGHNVVTILTSPRGHRGLTTIITIKVRKRRNDTQTRPSSNP